ncbi:hypothetical protein DRH27_04660 [Candidatus Falkowbacteria bacterium]|nr:MAG: hypothetical protein DRH27_04660 [Candidatus Falkowbacteria bacterium]
MVETCTIDAISQVETGLNSLGAVSTVPEMAKQLADISKTFQKLKASLVGLYGLERCGRFCTHEIKYCHCPSIARMAEQTIKKWDELTAENNSEG